MKLPHYEREDQIPQHLREYYIEQEGIWVPDSDEDEEARKNAEDVRKALAARDNEKSMVSELKKQLNEMKEKLGNRDPEEIQRMVEAAQHAEEERRVAEEERLKAEQKFEELAEMKYRREINTLQRQIQELEAARGQIQKQHDDLYQAHERVTIDQQLQSIGIGFGADPEKIPYLLHDARPPWKLNEFRKPIAVERSENGDEIELPNLTMEQQVKEILRDKPWMLLPNRGTDVPQQRANGVARNFQITREQARDNRYYESMRKRADEHGVDLEVAG